MVGPRSSRARRGADDGDAELAGWIEAARAGDADCYGWIWQRLSPRVHGYVRGRGARNPEDVTSEVFLAAFTGLARFSGSTSDFRAWLFTIAHHKLVDEYRRRADDAEYDPAQDPRQSPSAEARALHAELDSEVQEMLAALTAEQREVLLLRSLGDLSVEQVAEVTGRSVGAVKQLYHRAVATSRRTAEAPREQPAPVPPDPFPRSYGASGAIRSSSAVTQAASTPMTDM
jgi:RNA polymerase sigma-70 factor (ECF subfamily)